MSWPHHGPGVPGVPGHDGISAAMPGAAGAGLLDANGNVNLLNGLDMDMSLPMELDLDMNQPAQGYPLLPQHQASGASSQLQDQSMAHGTSDMVYHTQPQQQDEVNMTGAGAGPLPTSYGMPAPSGGSTLTEFTKRRNWSQRIIEELKDFLHILTPDGRILWVSPSCKAITGHEHNALLGKFIAEFVHPDDSGIFMREFNESIASGNGLRFFYRFKKDDGTYVIFECDGHPHISPDVNMNANQAPDQPPITGVCRGFFMMARPYPTKNAALLDSFLEHKIENERLMKRIEELKREEADENAAQDKLFREQGTTPSHQGITMSQDTASRIQAPQSAVDSAPEAVIDYQGMPPPAKSTPSNTALTRQNLDSALSSQRPEGIADKMSRYEAASNHMESIELLTGLRYRDGERSHGISTGDTSPALIRGDAGIAILLDRDRDGPKKDKKKQKLADEYVCADCGTLDSPEWRKGPKGPKTLCNACGLRWAKKEKKRSGDDIKTESPMGPMSSMTPGGTSIPMGGMSQPPGLPMQTSTGSSG